ncbi:MAG: hypothetical protein Q8L85_09265 [Alphaproteobacteria bacterium]|nr:hypothetical protein [Alphaproteobacteria bacterium]
MKFLNVLFLSLFFCTKSYAMKGLENIFTRDIYDQSELSFSATSTAKIALLKAKKQKLLDEKIINFKTIEIETLQKLLDEMNEKRNIATYFVLPSSYLLEALPYIISVSILSSAPFSYAPANGSSQKYYETSIIEFIRYMSSVIAQPGIAEHLYNDCVAYCKKRIKKLMRELMIPSRKAIMMLEQIAPVREVEHQLSTQSNLINSLKRQTSSGKIFDLECLYVSNKSKILANWQDKIESTFMSYYNQDVFHDKEFLDSMISHPTETKTLSQETNNEYFEILEAIITNLKTELTQKNISDNIQSDCEEILTSFANYAQETLDENITESTRYLAYCHLDSIGNADFQESSILIARAFGVPYYIVDAQNAVPDDVFLYGSYKIKKGLFLEALQAGTQKHLNSLLIIKNIDHWVKDITNILWLLKLFDNTTKKFDCKYLGFKVDWSKLNIICSGKTPLDQLDNAFQSRVVGFSF